MKNPFKNSSRDAITRQSESSKKVIRDLSEDPIIFGKVPEPAEEIPPPEAGIPWGEVLAKTCWIILGLFLFRWTLIGLSGGHLPDFDFIRSVFRQFTGW